MNAKQSTRPSSAPGAAAASELVHPIDLLTVFLTVLGVAAAGASAQGVEHLVGIIVYSNHHDLDGGQQFLEQGSAFDARTVRQINVHEHHVR